MRAAGVVRVVEAGKAFRACTLRGDPGILGWNPLGSEMVAGSGRDVHIDGQTLEQCMWRNVDLMYCYPPPTNAHTAAPRRGTLGPRCAISLCRLWCRAELYRACTSSSLISISPPPSWLGLSSGTTAGQSARLACRRLSRLPCFELAGTNTRPAQSRHHPNTLLASDDTSLHLHTTRTIHSLLSLCH